MGAAVSKRWIVQMPTRWLMLGVMVAGIMALVPLVAFAHGGDGARDGDRGRGERLMLGFTLSATGPTTTAGSFVASGSIQGAGESTVERLSVIPFGARDRGHLSGIQRFTTPQGTIVTRFRGTAHAISTNHQWGRGHFRIIDATGDYAGLRGTGRFTLVVNRTTNQLIGTEVARTFRRG